MKLNTALLALLAAGSVSQMHAGTAVTATSGKATVAIAPTDTCDKIWDLAKLYKNDNNHILEEFDFTGRFQLDYFNVDSNKGDKDFTEIRRLRLGVDTFWFDRVVEVKAELDTALRTYGAPELFYNRFTDLFIRLHFADEFNLQAGKFQQKFGYDREFSDNLSLIFERGLFDDQIYTSGNDYTPGARIDGKFGNWGYILSVFSDNTNKEFGTFDGGASEVAEISYDFKTSLGADKAFWALDYMHVGGTNAKTNVFANVRNGAATYFDYKKGQLGLVAQFGYDNQISSKGDLYDIQLQASYDITKKLVVVSRYQLGLADKANGFSTNNRQEKVIGKFTGDTYNAAYLGLDYLICGQHAKLMVGEQYAELTGGTGASAGYNGWTTLAGLRIFW